MVSEESKLNSSLEGEKLTDALGISPIKFQVCHNNIEDLSSSTMAKINQKVERAKMKLFGTLTDAIAPGQSGALMTRLHPIRTPEEDAELERFKKIYDNSDGYGKITVLSVIDHSKYSKAYLVQKLGCSKYQVETARSLGVLQDGIHKQINTPTTRLRLDRGKVEHFMDFLFSSGLLQDVSYGIKTIRFDSDEKCKVANAVLATKRSHAIAQYLQLCFDHNYSALHRSTLWKILRAIKPSQRKSLSELDDFAASAMNGFAVLASLIPLEHSSLIHALQNRKRYLKTSFQGHCSEVSYFCSHSTTYALSDGSENLSSSDCVDSQNFFCLGCFHLFRVLSDVEQSIMQTNDEEKVYDMREAMQSIWEYIQHLVRDAQQRLAKAEAFDCLDEKTALWLKDFAQ